MMLTAAAGLAAAAPGGRDPHQFGDGGVSDFYRWNAALPARPGVMLREQNLPLEPLLADASRALRILYSSTDGMRERGRIVVSGALYLPKGEPPAGGWPIVAWAHGTVGIADVCAPSWGGNAPDRQRYMDAWLKQGYAVVASDYQGLGTPGPHPYLIPEPEGYGTLDAVRAVLAAHPKLLANRVIATGQSQGSGAALAAGLLAPTYAPELDYRGTVAMGLVPKLRDAGGADQLPLPETWNYDDTEEAAFATLYLLGTVRALHPEIDPDQYISAAGQPVKQAALQGCFHAAIDAAAAHGVNMRTLYRTSVAALEDEAGKRSEFPSPRLSTPVMTVTGLKDVLAEPAQQYNLVSGMCHAGSAVQWQLYPGETHASAVNASLRDSIPFVARLFAGERPQGNCAALKPDVWAEASRRNSTDAPDRHAPDKSPPSPTQETAS
ncbi:MAG: lipase family protein [Pseudoxanthomonas sp.]